MKELPATFKILTYFGEHAFYIILCMQVLRTSLKRKKINFGQFNLLGVTAFV